MFLNWNEYRSSLLSVIGKFAKMQPEFMKGLAQMDKGVSEHGHLDAKTRELISLAVAVTTAATAVWRCTWMPRRSTAQRKKRLQRRCRWRFT